MAAASDLPQPNFEAMADSMNGIVRHSTELAINLGRMRNIPALDGGAQILAELRAMREDMGRRFGNIDRRFENMERRFDNMEQKFENMEQKFENMEQKFESMEQKFEDMERRQEQGAEAADYNAVARLTNSSLAVAVDSQLIPLRTRRNQEIEDFPATQGDINRLSSADLNAILERYDLPTVGNIAVRRRQLKKYLGITVAGI